MTDQKTRVLHAQLRDDLIAGEYQPGERLTEQSVASRYGASRTPVREVLARLEQVGLLQRHGAGLIVPMPSVQEVLDLCDAHALIECALARDAAHRRQEDDLIALQAAADHAAALPPSTAPPDLYYANQAFHHALSACAHNSVLADQQRQLELRMAALRATTLSQPGRWETSNDQHRLIVEAVAARDAVGVAEATRIHLEDARELWRLLIRLNKVPGLRTRSSTR